ncbi:MAG: chemotaxis protein CheW [Psychrobium sp.]
MDEKKLMESRSSKTVKDFFDVLLDEPKQSAVETQPLEKLLEKVGDVAPQVELSPELVDPSLLNETHAEPEIVVEAAPAAETVAEPVVKERVEINVEEVVEEPVNETATETAEQVATSTGPLHRNTLMDEVEEGFPALFFEVMGQTFSVPLVKLKGIYRKKSLTKLIGKPNWFSGVQIERDEKLNVIDTARYLMPEKYGASLEYSPNYQYIIVIGDSNWGLECNRLIDSTTLSFDEIKWRTDVTRSPWLAGTVKQRMCGLLAVDALIELFESNETK